MRVGQWTRECIIFAKCAYVIASYWNIFISVKGKLITECTIGSIPSRLDREMRRASTDDEDVTRKAIGGSGCPEPPTTHTVMRCS